MPPRSTRLLALVLGSFAAIATSFSTPASAKGPAPGACASAYGDGQERARAGHLREAKDLFLKCAKTTCGGFRKKCAAAADQTSSDLAHVAFVVTDAMDAPLVDVVVKMDGATLATRLDGRALPIDPGVHEFTFGARVGEPVRYVWTTRKIMVVEGQREPISVVMPPPHDENDATDAATVAEQQLRGGRAPAASKAKGPAAEKDSPAPPTETDASETSTGDEGAGEKAPSDESVPPPSPSSFAPAPPQPARHRATALPWVVGVVGVLGVGAGGALRYLGQKDDAALGRCAPSCKPASVELVHQLYVGSDVAFAAGGAVIGLAAVLLLTSHGSDAAPSGTASPGSRTRYSFDVRPMASGGLASFGAVF